MTGYYKPGIAKGATIGEIMSVDNGYAVSFLMKIIC